MRLRLVFSIAFLAVGIVAFRGIASKAPEADPRFEAHEFAVFRSEYETLRVQSPARRVEHFRDLLEVTETARVAPALAETLAEFCRKVATSEEEAPSVQAEARLVLQALETKASGRMPASVGIPK